LTWQPSFEFLEFASKYDAIVIGSRPDLNEVVVTRALSRERPRALVIAAPTSDPSLCEIMQRRIDGEISVVSIETHPASDATDNVVRLEKEIADGVPRSMLKTLLLRLTRMEVTSALSLPGLIDSIETANFGEFDKVTLAVPRNTYERGFGSRWVFGDIEFDLENARIQEAGEFTELTGYPSLQEVA
jgi:hypothetical protein